MHSLEIASFAFPKYSFVCSLSCSMNSGCFKYTVACASVLFQYGHNRVSCRLGYHMYFLKSPLYGSALGHGSLYTSILLKYEFNRVVDCRHRTLGGQQDHAHPLKPLVTAIQRLEVLWYQLHIWADCTEFNHNSHNHKHTFAQCLMCVHNVPLYLL